MLIPNGYKLQAKVEGTWADVTLLSVLPGIKPGEPPLLVYFFHQGESEIHWTPLEDSEFRIIRIP